MPQSISRFDRMNIPAPCEADWDSMIGNDQVRLCEHYDLRVTDLSAMTRRKAMDFVARAEGRVCVRFIQKPNGRVLTRTMPEKLYRIQRRVLRIAAGAFTATLSISSAMARSRPVSSSNQPREAVDEGETALMKAVSAADSECVQALLKAGADPTAKNKECQTALTLAREYEDSEIAKLLESRGAPE